jgi:hypothetical protein
MPAAGDSNPTWFIAKFQRNRPLPPFYTQNVLTAPPEDLFGICAFDALMSKAVRKEAQGHPPNSSPGKRPQEGHFHVPGNLPASIKFACEDAYHSRTYCRIHTGFHSITSAIASGTIHMHPFCGIRRATDGVYSTPTQKRISSFWKKNDN